METEAAARSVALRKTSNNLFVYLKESLKNFIYLLNS